MCCPSNPNPQATAPFFTTDIRPDYIDKRLTGSVIIATLATGVVTVSAYVINKKALTSSHTIDIISCLAVPVLFGVGVATCTALYALRRVKLLTGQCIAELSSPL